MRKILLPFLSVFALLQVSSAALGVDQPQGAAVAGKDIGGAKNNEGKNLSDSRQNGKQTQADQFDFSDNSKSGPEQDYLDLDETIKLRVDPVMHSAVVDRLAEPATVYVNAPGAQRAEIYLEPVDSPYCGKATGEPKLIGKSQNGRGNFAVVWNEAQPYRYVKIYALVYKRGGQLASRSRSLSFCMAGMRLQAQPTK